MTSVAVPTRVRGSRGSSRGRSTDTPPDPLAGNTQAQRQAAHRVFNSSSEHLCPGYKGVSCFPVSQPNPNVKAAMKTAVPTMDTDDFDRLPPAIRRKFFSSLERLRYAQTATVPTQGHIRTRSSISTRFVPSRIRPGRASSDAVRTRTSGSTHRHRNAADAFVLSQTDAQWFLALPETVQRKHFSREERILLANKCESIIVDAADEALYRLGRQTTSRDNRFSIGSISSVSDIGSLYRPSFESDIQKAREEVRKSFRWMEEAEDLDLQLQQFNQENANSKPPTSRKRRTLSLTTRNLRTPTSSSGSTLRRGPSLSRRSGSRSSIQPPPFIRRNTHTADSDATYYQDPEARLKLRVYLASPQKFDEAVEFGFPAQAGDNFFGARSKVSTPEERLATAEIRSFESEMIGKFDSELNNTPQTVEVELEDVGPSSPTLPTSKGSGSNKPVDRYPHIRPGNREMTLRMTLTRKDLRATEEAPYDTKDKALVLEPLPPETEQCVIDWDALDREAESGLKKLWRKVKGH